ncbi:uncharacterized protein LOC131066017 [Cryptomeria japonica]|uniref:uncharacterized protein LOC131066017 n=1 Tax=Cryptomeria japonica TaxID=3369 RepID=UPI0027D9D64C|nr:uncharacterized protein LOC131066017 [Cryptomeria japonica]
MYLQQCDASNIGADQKGDSRGFWGVGLVSSGGSGCPTSVGGDSWPSSSKVFPKLALAISLVYDDKEKEEGKQQAAWRRGVGGGVAEVGGGGGARTSGGETKAGLRAEWWFSAGGGANWAVGRQPSGSRGPQATTVGPAGVGRRPPGSGGLQAATVGLAGVERGQPGSGGPHAAVAAVGSPKVVGSEGGRKTAPRAKEGLSVARGPRLSLSMGRTDNDKDKGPMFNVPYTPQRNGVIE